MCGRYSLSSTGDLLERFGLTEIVETRIPARFNIAPTDRVPVVVEDRDGGRGLRRLKWGFQPAWMKQAPGARPAPINARAETLLERNLFRSALAKNRCLIPADGFYEWLARAGSKTKQPMYARLKDGGLFAFAGLFTGPRVAESDPEDGTCVIITTSANEIMKPIHDRMPVILDPEAEARWLSYHETEPAAVMDLLRPAAPERMEVFPVSPLVSNVRNDGPRLIEPFPNPA